MEETSCLKSQFSPYILAMSILQDIMTCVVGGGREVGKKSREKLSVKKGAGRNGGGCVPECLLAELKHTMTERFSHFGHISFSYSHRSHRNQVLDSTNRAHEQTRICHPCLQKRGLFHQLCTRLVFQSS